MSEERIRKRTELRWLSGFGVLGTLLAVPGLLPVVNNLDLDADPSQAGLRFFSFGAGFLLASAATGSLLRKFGVRCVAAAGLAISMACLVAITLAPPILTLGWQLAPVLGTGLGAALLSTACLFALKPWSSRLGAQALPRVAAFACFGCMFSAATGALAYLAGWERFAPVPVCAAVLLCLVLTVTGRSPLAVVEKRAPLPEPGIRHHRSIAFFLLLALLFVQLGSEWSVAGWLPLFLMHRLGSGPAAAIGVLLFFFLALLCGRLVMQKSSRKLGSRMLIPSGLVLSLAGCLTLALSGSIGGILTALAVLALGLAPPYVIVKNVLNEDLHFPPGFYQAILSVAVLGAMFAPWLVGYTNTLLGVGALPLFPAAGATAVLVLELLLFFESHLMEERAAARTNLPAQDRLTS